MDELDCGWSDVPAGVDSEYQYDDCPPAVAQRHLGWAADTVVTTSPTHGIGLSPDLLTATVCGGTTAYSGVLGAARFEHGTQNFAVRVTSPVDDAFWIGVAYCDLVWVDHAPKANPNCIVWSGGDTTAGKSRPGTMRVHGAKFPNKPTFSTGDAVGVEVNLTTKTLSFYLNGARVATFPRVLQGPCAPYFVCSVGGGPAATLVQWPFPSEPVQGEEGGLAPLLAEEELAQSHEVVIDGAALEGGGQVIRVAVGCAALFRSVLLIAATRGDLPLLRDLLGRGADPNRARPIDGWTPLMAACVRMNARGATEATRETFLAIIRLLLGRGADPNLPRSRSHLISGSGPGGTTPGPAPPRSRYCRYGCR